MADAGDPERPRGESEHPSPMNQSTGNVTGSESHDVFSVGHSDAKLKALLDEQARIFAEIKALMPPKNGVDAQQELIMLNHKQKMLRLCQEDHGLAPVVLSVEEECRLLQYRCECLEVSCLQSGKYISAGDLLGKGSSALRSIQPPGFEDWLRTNATKYDPVLKQSPIGEALRDMKIPSSLKCPEEKCIHYIYGFSNSESLEDHKQRQHYNPKKPIVPQPSSALSYPPNQIETDDHIRARVDPSFEPLLEQSKPSTIDKHPPSAAKDPRAGWESRPDPPSPKMARRPIVKPQVKTGCNTCKSRRVKCDETRPHCYRCARWGRICEGYPETMPSGTPDKVSVEEKPLHNFAFVHEYPTHSDDHSDYKSGISSHPTKRPRLDLNDRNEPNLMKEVGPCLRCKILKKKCDSGDPCSLCPEQDSLAESDYWKALGCHRGSLLSFAEILVPNELPPLFSSENQIPLAHTSRPTETFRAFAAAWWEEFRARRSGPPLQSDELMDEFGFTWPIQTQDNPDSQLKSLSSLIPPAYVLAVERNKHDSKEVGYSLVELLRFSASVSGRSSTECQDYPLLAFSKLLFQEAIVFQSSYVPTRRLASQLTYDRYGILSITCANFIRAFDDTTQHRSSWSPRKWVAAFCSLCFLRAALCLLDDGFCFIEKKHALRTSHSNNIHSVYKALVSIFAWSTPSALDDEDVKMSPEDQNLLSGLKQILLRDRWAEFAILSAKDFLIGLGSGVFKDGFFEDFVLRRRYSPYPYTDSSLKSDYELTISTPTIDEPQSASRRVGLMEDSASTSASQSMYQKPKPERVYCNQCEDHPDGFRGEHELKRHQDRVHRRMTKKWICVQPTGSHPQPQLPLSQCKSCSVQRKKYGAYYNAAAHLRRAHFTPKARGRSKQMEKRGGKAGGDWPPMSELKHWMEEIEEPASDWPQIATEHSAEDDDDLHNKTESSMSAVYSNITPQTSKPFMTFPSLNQMPTSLGSPLTQMSAPPILMRQLERPEKCPISTCEYHTKGFARINDKNRHVLSHYIGIIACPFCPGVGTPKEKTFSRADVLKRHLTGVHNVEQAPPIMRMRGEEEMESISSEKKGECSICSKEYEGIQAFYDHLDDCVLAVVAPPARTGSAEEETSTPILGAQEVQNIRD